jgi:hypothetical protein
LAPPKNEIFLIFGTAKNEKNEKGLAVSASGSASLPRSFLHVEHEFPYHAVHSALQCLNIFFISRRHSAGFSPKMRRSQIQTTDNCRNISFKAIVA